MPEPDPLPSIKTPWGTTTPPSGAPPGDIPPIPIPDHTLIRRIGKGSYGEVWLARNALGVYRAVKIIHRGSFDDARPFEREFAGMQRFEPVSRSHESQLNILHVGRGPDCFYYVMELADDMGGAYASGGTALGGTSYTSSQSDPLGGTSTASPTTPTASKMGPRVTRPSEITRPADSQGVLLNPDTYTPRNLRSELLLRGRLPVDECLRLGLALTTALEHLHRHGLVHRDIKPSNIVFVNGIPKLADIGLVALADSTMSFVGTEGYLPPEGPGTVQADLFSLGKVLYEISTGRDRQQFPELPTGVTELPDRAALAEFNEVLVRACAPDVKERYESAAEMHADLALLQSGRSVVRLRGMERRLRFVQRAGALVTVIAALAAGLYFWQARQARQMKRLATEARENLYAADISQIQHALETDNLRQARELLQNHIPKPGERDLRGFEWRYLWQRCRSEELFALRGHEQTATRVAFSPDGRLLVTGSIDNTAKVWELASHRLLATLLGHTDSVVMVSFSPKGDVLATGSETDLRVWDARTFQPVRSIRQFADRARFSPDGQYFAAGGTNVILRDARTWEAVSTLDLPEFKKGTFDYNGVGFAFSPDNRRIALVLWDGVRLLGVPGLQEQVVLKDPMPRIRFVAFSPDGRTLATCTMGHEVKLWDVEAKTPSRVLAGHSGSVAMAVFSPDGNRLATCSLDQTVKLWDVASGTLVRTLQGHTEEVWDVAFSPDGKQLASVSKDGAVKLWDPYADPEQPPDLSSLFPVGFDPVGNLVCKNKGDGFTALDPETLQQVSASLPPIHDSYSVNLGCLSCDGHTIGLRPDDRNEAEVWDLQRREFICSVESLRPKIVFAPKTHLLATSTTNQTVTVWQLPQGLGRFVLTNTSAPLAFSPDERILVTRGETRSEVKLWSMGDDHPRLAVSLSNRFQEPVAFSPNGRTLACGSWGGFVRLLALPSGQEIASLVGHKRDLRDLSFSPDGRTLATVSDDGTVRLWHVATRRELLRFATPMKDPWSHNLMFSPDGRTLVAHIKEHTGAESRTYVWHAPSFDEIAAAEGR